MATGGAAAAIASGLLLDVALAARLGAGHRSDAFFAGMRLPLGAVAIVMAGANQALVPLFSTWFVELGDKPPRRVPWPACSTPPWLPRLLLAGVLAIFAGPVVAATVPGFNTHDADAAAAVARIGFFIIPMVCGAEVLRAYLNARYAYVVAAAMNVTMSCTSAVLVIAGRRRHDPLGGLGLPGGRAACSCSS